tara:strand:- start:2103 stop:2318 length:216 start_codon:yes stop_codon:yes gene_type:complete
MQKEKKYPESNDAIQRPGIEKALEGGKLEGIEGGLREDLFNHDGEDEGTCICDLPEHAQDIIWNEIENGSA